MCLGHFFKADTIEIRTLFKKSRFYSQISVKVGCHYIIGHSEGPRFKKKERPGHQLQTDTYYKPWCSQLPYYFSFQG